MFQAIKQYFPTRVFLFLLLATLNGSIAQTKPAPAGETQNKCGDKPTEIPPEFFLSKAIRIQVEGFSASQQRRTQEARDAFLQSKDLVDTYHQCLETIGKGPTKFSSELQSLNYLELGDLKQAFEWSELAKSKTSPTPRDLILLQTRIRIRQGELKLAAELLEADLARFPNDFDFLYLLGSLYTEQKIWNRSLLYYTALSFAIQRRDTNSKYKNLVNRTLGELNYKLDFPKISIKHYEEYTNAAPNDTEVLFRLAQIYFVLGDFGKCKSYLEEIRKRNPRDIDASHMLLEVSFVSNRSLARSYLEVLRRENKIPKDGIINILDRHLSFERDGLKEEVIKFIQKNPQRLSPKLVLLELTSKENKDEFLANTKEAGRYAYEYRQFLVAKKLLQDALTLIQDDPKYTNEISAIWEQISFCEEMMAKPNHAILAQKLAIESQTDPQKKDKNLFRLSYLYVLPKINREKDSIEILSSLISKSAIPSYFYLRGLAYYQSELYLKSHSDFNQAVKLEPNNSVYTFYRAMASDKLKNFEEAEKDLYETIRLNPNASNAMNYLGYMYAEKNMKPEEALSLLNSAIQIEPDNAAFQDSIGWVQFRKKNLDESLLHLNFAASLATEREIEDPVIYDHLGDVYVAKKDPVNALVFFNMALEKSKPADKKNLEAKIKKIKQEISK
ncbi:MAG: tetratricopeptide repeat protein [Leptospira sp.]|nr:tetratricopeptide repeat protein [Leptospira sp.]